MKEMAYDSDDEGGGIWLRARLHQQAHQHFIEETRVSITSSLKTRTSLTDGYISFPLTQRKGTSLMASPESALTSLRLCFLVPQLQRTSCICWFLIHVSHNLTVLSCLQLHSVRNNRLESCYGRRIAIRVLWSLLGTCDWFLGELGYCEGARFRIPSPLFHKLGL
ncbi:hypothetical protein EDC04DRAFT_2824031 [Pisolithus marmoratus]|nr:hypothetical protein EDC04DRAFT_2824031 [Pisolithus marmoratus]